MNNDRKSSFSPENDDDIAETVKTLRDAAQQIVPKPEFVAKLEYRLAASHPGPAVKTMFAARRVAPVLLWVLAAIAMVIAIDWAIRSIAPQPVPAARNTPAATAYIPAPPVDQSTPVPSSKSYDWHGTTLTLAAGLPDGPAEAGVYAAQPEQPATLDQATALAQRFGINGAAYQTPGEIAGTTDFLITDGKQRLRVRSESYFGYTADVITSYNNVSAVQKLEATTVIDEFMQSHGFNFPHRVQWSDYMSAYIIEPLTPENTPLRYEHFAPPILYVKLDMKGRILEFDATRLETSNKAVGRFGIISAEAAFQRILDPNTASGMIESMNSAPHVMQVWNRVYPASQTLTIYGNVSSAPSVQPGQPAFIQVDGYPVTGQVAGLDQFAQLTYVAATGQFVEVNGIKKFRIDSWKLSDVNEDGLLGTLAQQNGHAVLTTQEGTYYVLPDVPTDMPMPFENAYVIGTKQGDLFQWKTIDDRMATQGGGGGGGGGGSGFYKLNLTGTPVPFPTATVATDVTGTSGSNDAQYTVQAGDTLGKIAQHFALSVDQVAQANGIADPSQLTIGQTLIIPGTPSMKIEGLRGMLNVTINKQQDGNQQLSYGFLPNANSQPSGYMMLEGDGLETLQQYNSRPVDIWGTLEGKPGGVISVVKVDRFEIPFPDLKVQILKGTQKLSQLGGQPATLFIAEDGTTYVQLLSDATTGGSLIGNEGDQVLVEAVAVPGETVNGYPGLRVFAAAMAINPKTGQPSNLLITADKPTIIDAPSIGKPPQAPAATIEKVELIHFMSAPRYAASTASQDSQYFQPVWCFSGHYSNGDEFEILIQALQQQYLLPEIAPALQPG